MPNPAENSKYNEGFTMIKHELYDWTIRAKLRGPEQKIIHAIIRHTNGYNQREEAPMSLRFFEELTGIHHWNAEKIINNLLKKKIIFRRAGDKMKWGKAVHIYRLNKAHCRLLNASLEDCRQPNASAGVNNTPEPAVNHTPIKDINKTYRKDIQDKIDRLRTYKLPPKQ